MKSISAQEIATLVQGRLEGNAAVRVESAAGLDDASQNQISFFHNIKYLASLKASRAGIILLPEKIERSALPSDSTLIFVENPQLAFGQVLTFFDQGRQRHPQGVHPTAVIEEGAQVDPTVSVGAHAVIQAGVTIGANSIIYPNVFIGTRTKIGANALLYPNVVIREDTLIGDRVIIQAGAVIGGDGYGFSSVKGKHYKIPQIGRVFIGHDVEIGANAAIDRATTGETRIGDGTKIDNLVHIAHNVHIGSNCLIVGQVGIAGSTFVGNNVIMGGQVGIVGHVKIGDNVILAAQSGIMNDVAPGEVLFGSPARPHKLSLKLQALYGKLPEIYDAIKGLRKKEPDELKR